MVTFQSVSNPEDGGRKCIQNITIHPQDMRMSQNTVAKFK